MSIVYWIICFFRLQTEPAQAQPVGVWSSAPSLESVKTCENLCWNTVCLGWKAVRRGLMAADGCCVLTLNFGGSPPHPLLRGTWVLDLNQSVGIGNLLEWFKGGMITWAASLQAAAQALESCAATLAYSTTMYNSSSTSKRPKHVSELLTQIHTLKISSQILTNSRNMRAV